MALQHLRSGTANKRPLPTAMSDGQIAVNTNLASPGLFFKDGNGDLVKVGPVHIGTTAPNASPASTAATALVANTIYKILTVGTSDFTTVGASANTVGVVFTASGTTTGTGTVSGEQGNEKGEQWLDTTGGTYVLKIYDGTAWRSESGTFVDASGDTMTGDLLFNNANIVFEGSAADDHETTLTVVNPTADRTITLPNVSGTVVTTGDTGSVTSTMITDGTIVNADVNAGAEIAVSKLANGTARQLLQTDSGGTGVEFTSNVDIPGTLDVTGVTTFDVGATAGSDTNTANGLVARNNASSETGATIWAINKHADGYVFVGNDEFVNVRSSIANDGKAEFTTKITVDNVGSDATLWLKNGPSAGSGQDAEINFGNTEGTGKISYSDAGNKMMLFYVDGYEIMRLKDYDTTAAGTNIDHRVGIGTSSPYSMLDVEDGAQFVERSTIGNNDPRIKLEKVVTTEGGGTVITGKITTDNLVTTGNVGIGTASPQTIAHVYGANPILRIQDSSAPIADAFAAIQLGESGSSGETLGNYWQIAMEGSSVTSTDHLTFKDGSGERLRIDSSGNVGIGTSSPVTNLDVNGRIAVVAGSSSTPSFHCRTDTNTGINLPESDRIQLITGGAERMRIDSSGNVGIGTTSPSNLLHVKRTTTANSYAIIENTTGGNAGINIKNADGSWTLIANDALRFMDEDSSTERMRIDSSGRLLVGTSSASAISKLIVQGYVGGSDGFMSVRRGAAGGDNQRIGCILFDDSSENIAARIDVFGDGAWGTNDYPGRLVFSTTADGASSPTEAMQIDSSGNVGIGTSSPQHSLHLHREDSNLNYLQITNSATGSGSNDGCLFGINSTEEVIVWQRAANNILLGTNNTERMRIDSSGNLSLGRAEDAATRLDVRRNGTGTIGFFADDVGAGLYIKTSSSTVAGFSSRNVSTALNFEIGGSEKAQIDTSGRLLVGTSSAPSDTANGAHYSKLVSVGNSSSSTGDGRLALCRGTTASSLSSGNGIAEIHFADSAGGGFAYIAVQADGTPGANDYPGRLLFATTADGASSPTERMRISSKGRFSTVSTDGAAIVFATTKAASSSDTLILGKHSSNGSVDNGSDCFVVRSNGNVQNTSNSYGAISDIKLKENIVDASSQWNDLKALQVRNYNFIEGQTHTQIGVVAQEVELVSPGLVSESPDRDEEDNDLGTVTKSVNYSVLYMKAVKALQEAMERIETLEQRLSDAGIA